MKRCSKCKQEKEFNYFCKNNRYKDGRHDTCKQCRKEYNKDNKEKIIEYEKQWRANNRDYGKQWRINNPDKYKILYTINNSKKTKEQITLDNKLSQSYKAEWTKDKYRKKSSFIWWNR
jgi:hypothetical protein